MSVDTYIQAEIDELRRKLLTTEHERDQLRRHLIACRQQNEHMLAVINKLHSDIRSEQSRDPLALLPKNILRGR